MALKFIEGFDWISTDEASDLEGADGRWTDVSNDAAIWRATGRFGSGYSLATGNQVSVLRGMDGIVPNTNAMIVGFAFKHNATGQRQACFRLKNSSTVIGMLVKKDTTNQLGWVAGGTPTSGSVGFAWTSTQLTANTWYYVEVKIKTDTTASGQVDIYVNGVNEVSEAGANVVTYNNPTNMELWTQSAADPKWFDDLYLADTTAGSVSDVIGDVRVLTELPTGDSSPLEWTPQGASVHYDEVDAIETDANKDNTYIETNVSAEEDRFSHAGFGLAAGDTVYGVQIGCVMKALDASPQDTKLIVWSDDSGGGGTASNPTAQTPASTYGGHYEMYENDPDTSTTWTVNGANGCEFGVKTA